MVPPEAFSIEAAQASADGCIGCDAGTQWAKRHSTVLSCASAGPAHNNEIATKPFLRDVMHVSMGVMAGLVPAVPARDIQAVPALSGCPGQARARRNNLTLRGRLDQRTDVAGFLDIPELLHQGVGACIAKHRTDKFDELGLKSCVVERHDTRAERLIGLAHELAARRADCHAGGPQLWVKAIDLRGRRDGEFVRELP